MQIQDLDKIVKQAIDNKKILEVNYIRDVDGVATQRLMEPYDVSTGKFSTTGKLMFWGWCLEHDRIEQKFPDNITSITITSQNFVPRKFSSTPDYRIPREW